MHETPALSTILLAVAVVALLVVFFGGVAYQIWGAGKSINAIFDGRAERQRQRLEYEAKHGTPPAWKQALRRLIQIVLILAALGLAWLRLRGA